MRRVRVSFGADLLFAIEPCGGEVLDEVDAMISAGNAGATLIEWDGNATDAINRAVAAFLARGWQWDGHNLRKCGWVAWFRSQGELAPPVIQWMRVS